MEKIITAEELARDMREISVAEFFERNKHFLGYENPTKGLLTIVKEAVDNSLEFSTEAGILPDVKVKVKQIAEDKFRVMVEDNGPGIVEDQVPMAFAKVLYGSRFYVLKQSRSLFGIGIKGACLYSQLTTGKPIKVESGIGKGPIHVFELMIDVAKNEPKIISHTTKENPNGWHGIKIEMEVEGRYIEGGHSILNYLKQTAMSNPFAKITFDGPKGKITFNRVTRKLPPKPKEIKPHPYGVEIGVLRRMLTSTKTKNLLAFLTTEFSRVGKRSAKQICKKAKIDFNRAPQMLTHQESERLYKAIQTTKLIAPPTNCLSPLGESLLVEGLKKETQAEYVVSVTRPPSVYRGMPFQVECCTGDTQIILEDGNRIKIKEYVEKMRNEKVLAMDKNFKIVPTPVVAVHKIPLHHNLFKIVTRSGKELVLTGNNEIPVLADGKLIWKKTEELKKGEYIATPRILRILGKQPFLIDLLEKINVKVHDSKLIGKITDELRRIYNSYKNAAKEIGMDYERFKSFRKRIPARPTLFEVEKMVRKSNLNWNDVKKEITRITYVNNKFYNPIPINIPSFPNEELLYLVGLIQSDGHMCRKKWQVEFVNKNKKLLEMFSEKTEKLFGIKCKKKKCYCYVNNKTLFVLIEKIIHALPTLEDSLIASWLKGIVDGDGSPSVKNGRVRIEICTATKDEAMNVQYALLRLGIISRIIRKKPTSSVGYINGRKIKPKKSQINVEIGDRENIEKFAKLISFRHPERKLKFELGLKKTIEARSSTDIIPIGSLLREARIAHNFKQYELGFSDDSIRAIEKCKKNITRKHLQQIATKLQSCKMIQLLSFSDILWDKIVKIRKVNKKINFVYDLTTSTGNFIANNVIIHNCALGYGGSLPEENALLFRFANKVPLFYHQGDCVITEAVKEVDWHRYGISQSKGQLPSGPLGILVHFASVWVPFTSEGKQAIAAYPEILKEIRLALQDAGRKLASYIRKKARLREQMVRRQIFERYSIVVAESLAELTERDKEDILKKLLAYSKSNIQREEKFSEKREKY